MGFCRLRRAIDFCGGGVLMKKPEINNLPLVVMLAAIVVVVITGELDHPLGLPIALIIVVVLALMLAPRI